MRKTVLALATIGMSLVLALALVGCGGGQGQSDATTEKADLLTDFTWYKAQVPADWEVRFIDGKYAWNAEFGIEDDDSFCVKVLLDTGTSADEQLEHSLEYWGDHTAGDDVTIGEHTWKVENFTWDGDAPSQTLYLDAPDGESCIAVDLFCCTTDDENVRQFLESMEFAEDTKAAYYEAANVPSSEVDVKR